MARGAKVESLDVLKDFRISLIKFGHTASVALDEADAELSRVLAWLEIEQPTIWNSEIRKRNEIVSRCMEAVRMKKVFKNSVGGRDSSVEEEKALATAQRRLREAEQKLVATKQWARKMHKEVLLYKGQAQRFSTVISSEIPVAAAHLTRMLQALQAYVALTMPSLDSAAPAAASSATFSFADALASMARPEGEDTPATTDPAAQPDQPPQPPAEGAPPEPTPPEVAPADHPPAPPSPQEPPKPENPSQE